MDEERAQKRMPIVRPTLRAMPDLGLLLPDISTPLDELAHPVLDKARETVGSYPQNLVRI